MGTSSSISASRSLKNTARAAASAITSHDEDGYDGASAGRA